MSESSGISYRPDVTIYDLFMNGGLQKKLKDVNDNYSPYNGNNWASQDARWLTHGTLGTLGLTAGGFFLSRYVLQERGLYDPKADSYKTDNWQTWAILGVGSLFGSSLLTGAFPTTIDRVYYNGSGIEKFLGIQAGPADSLNILDMGETYKPLNLTDWTTWGMQATSRLNQTSFYLDTLTSGKVTADSNDVANREFAHSLQYNFDSRGWVDGGTNARTLQNYRVGYSFVVPKSSLLEDTYKSWLKPGWQYFALPLLVFTKDFVGAELYYENNRDIMSLPNYYLPSVKSEKVGAMGWWALRGIDAFKSHSIGLGYQYERGILETMPDAGFRDFSKHSAMVSYLVPDLGGEDKSLPWLGGMARLDANFGPIFENSTAGVASTGDTTDLTDPDEATVGTLADSDYEGYHLSLKMKTDVNVDFDKMEPAKDAGLGTMKMTIEAGMSAIDDDQVKKYAGVSVRLPRMITAPLGLIPGGVGEFLKGIRIEDGFTFSAKKTWKAVAHVSSSVNPDVDVTEYGVAWRPSEWVGVGLFGAGPKVDFAPVFEVKKREITGLNGPTNETLGMFRLEITPFTAPTGRRPGQDYDAMYRLAYSRARDTAAAILSSAGFVAEANEFKSGKDSEFNGLMEIIRIAQRQFKDEENQVKAEVDKVQPFIDGLNAAASAKLSALQAAAFQASISALRERYASVRDSESSRIPDAARREKFVKKINAEFELKMSNYVATKGANPTKEEINAWIDSIRAMVDREIADINASKSAADKAKTIAEFVRKFKDAYEAEKAKAKAVITVAARASSFVAANDKTFYGDKAKGTTGMIGAYEALLKKAIASKDANAYEFKMDAFINSLVPAAHVAMANYNAGVLQGKFDTQLRVVLADAKIKLQAALVGGTLKSEFQAMKRIYIQVASPNVTSSEAATRYAAIEKWIGDLMIRATQIANADLESKKTDLTNRFQKALDFACSKLVRSDKGGKDSGFEQRFRESQTNTFNMLLERYSVMVTTKGKYKTEDTVVLEARMIEIINRLADEQVAGISEEADRANTSRSLMEVASKKKTMFGSDKEQKEAFTKTLFSLTLSMWNYVKDCEKYIDPAKREAFRAYVITEFNRLAGTELKTSIFNMTTISFETVSTDKGFMASLKFWGRDEESKQTMQTLLGVEAFVSSITYKTKEFLPAAGK